MRKIANKKPANKKPAVKQVSMKYAVDTKVIIKDLNVYGHILAAQVSPNGIQYLVRYMAQAPMECYFYERELTSQRNPVGFDLNVPTTKGR